jgi:hypothetical protein
MTGSGRATLLLPAVPVVSACHDAAGPGSSGWAALTAGAG